MTQQVKQFSLQFDQDGKLLIAGTLVEEHNIAPVLSPIIFTFVLRKHGRFHIPTAATRKYRKYFEKYGYVRFTPVPYKDGFKLVGEFIVNRTDGDTSVHRASLSPGKSLVGIYLDSKLRSMLGQVSDEIECVLTLKRDKLKMVMRRTKKAVNSLAALRIRERRDIEEVIKSLDSVDTDELARRHIDLRTRWAEQRIPTCPFCNCRKGELLNDSMIGGKTLTCTRCRKTLASYVAKYGLIIVKGYEKWANQIRKIFRVKTEQITVRAVQGA